MVKLRWVVLTLVVIAAFLFRRELRKQAAFVKLYYDVCFPEVYPGTCPTIAELARVQYDAWEGAVIGVANYVTNPKRLMDWTPIAACVVGGAWAIRRFRRKGLTIDWDQDIFEAFGID